MMMPFRPEHLPTVQEWCRMRGMGEFPEGWLPPTGYIVSNVAAMFWYPTNSKLAFIECVISNPNSTKSERNHALDLITDAIIHDATKAGFLYLQGLSANSSLIGHAKALGFKIIGPECRVLLRRL